MFKVNQPAPDFIVKDVWGNNVELNSFKGKKTLLTFYWHVGCRVNHRRFLELQAMGHYLKQINLVLPAVYELCTEENLQTYSKDEQFHAQLFAAP